MTTGLGGPREDRWVLAVDLGTGGPKVGLVSLSGVIACTEHLPVPTDLGADGQATQDAGLWWDLIRGAARRAVDSGVVRADRIVAVSCTGQWASTVPVDVHGVPVGACQLWSDTRGGPHSRRVVGGPVAGYAPLAAVRWIRHSGGAPSTSGADPIGHILHLEHDEPEVARAARWYLEPVDYLSMRFTGTAAATPASMAGAWLTDNRVADPVAYDPVLVAAAGVPAGKLPPLRPTASEIGTVLPEVADDLGLPRGVVVVAGTPDLHSACVGSGSVLPFEPHVAISTTSWVSCPFPKKKTDPVHQMATVPGILPGLRLVANNQESGGGALDWLRGCLDGERGPTERDPPPSTSSRPWPAPLPRGAVGSCSPRGSPVSGRRSTTAGRVPASTTCPCVRPGPRWSDPSWRGSHSTRVGWPGPSNGSSAAPWARFGPSGAAPPRRCGAPSSPACSTARWSRWTSPSWPTCAERR